MLNDTHEVKLWSMEKNREHPNQWKGTKKGRKNIPCTVPELLRQQGMIIGSFIFPSLWLWRVAELVWVTLHYIFHSDGI